MISIQKGDIYFKISNVVIFFILRFTHVYFQERVENMLIQAYLNRKIQVPDFLMIIKELTISFGKFYIRLITIYIIPRDNLETNQIS